MTKVSRGFFLVWIGRLVAACVDFSMATTSPSLLHRLRDANSSAAWEKFVHLYTPLLIHWIRRLGLGAEESADVSQEVLLLLLVKLPGFRYSPQHSFRAWLRTVTMNKTRDYLRKKQAREKYEALAAAIEAEAEQSVFTDQEFRQALSRRALELMKSEFEETTWKACWESSVHGRKAAEIAAELGISINAVYLAKGRVLKRLRAELDGMF